MTKGIQIHIILLIMRQYQIVVVLPINDKEGVQSSIPMLL